MEVSLGIELYEVGRSNRFCQVLRPGKRSQTCALERTDGTAITPFCLLVLRGFTLLI